MIGRKLSGLNRLTRRTPLGTLGIQAIRWPYLRMNPVYDAMRTTHTNRSS